MQLIICDRCKKPVKVPYEGYGIADYCALGRMEDNAWIWHICNDCGDAFRTWLGLPEVPK